MSILSGHEIRKQVAVGDIEIDPYDESRVQPNSVDLTLGSGVSVYKGAVHGPGHFMVSSSEWSESLKPATYAELDSRRDNHIVQFTLDQSGWLVKPGILYLMHTAERIHTMKYVTQLNGKSSLARLGIIVHFTAAYGETGFNGQYTLEVSAMHPVRLYPGMAIAQAVFYTVEGEVEDYRKKGHYVGKASMGAQPSRSWQQFERKS